MTTENQEPFLPESAAAEKPLTPFGKLWNFFAQEHRLHITDTELYDIIAAVGEYLGNPEPPPATTATKPEAAPLCRIGELARFIKDIADKKDVVEGGGMPAGSTAIISVRRHAAEILRHLRELPFATKIIAGEQEASPPATTSEGEKEKDLG